MRAFKNKWFSRFAKKNHISDEKLRDITNGLEQGRWDADLGLDVYKVRVARPNAGKSHGLRTIVLFRQGEKAFFEYVFAKSEQDNIEDWELKNFRDRALKYFALTDTEIGQRIQDGKLVELKMEDSNALV
jgi:hypothetical protein